MIYIVSFFGCIIFFWIGIKIGEKSPNRKKYEHLDINNEGEAIVEKKLKEWFKREDNYLINNVTIIKDDNGTSQIDHILINEYGIFVIETKHYSGWIFGRKEDYKWTQSFGKNKYRFYNPIKQNENHIKHLRKKIDFIEDYFFRSIVIFSGTGVIKTDRIENVIHLEELKQHIQSYEFKVIKKEDIYKAIGAIEFERKVNNKETEQAHIDYVQKKYIKEEKERPH